ncbi:MAG: hypothetical protein H3C62_09040 [Gemmatimonadaceae bacterium]|nr:hypothetical protein [Gemmatimonadaceae bacterium]
MTPRSPWGRRVAGLAVAAVALVALRAASLVSLRTASAGESVLRLSWSARPERIEQCRRLTDAELAERPQHMRLRWECEGRFARYLLTVSVDGRSIASDTVRGGGLRNDRPMHLFREYALSPGERRLAIALRRVDANVRPDSASDQTAAGTAAADRETREAQERRVRRAEALPELVAIDTVVVIPSGRVALISYATDGRQFILKVGQ